eukprot:gene8988-biopygen139
MTFGRPGRARPPLFDGLTSQQEPLRPMGGGAESSEARFLRRLPVFIWQAGHGPVRLWMYPNLIFPKACWTMPDRQAPGNSGRSWEVPRRRPQGIKAPGVGRWSQPGAARTSHTPGEQHTGAGRARHGLVLFPQSRWLIRRSVWAQCSALSEHRLVQAWKTLAVFSKPPPFSSPSSKTRKCRENVAIVAFDGT